MWHSPPAYSAAAASRGACRAISTSPTDFSPSCKTSSSGSISPSTTPATAPTPLKRSARFPTNNAATTLYLTINSLRSPSAMDSVSVKYPAPPATSRKPRPSIFAAALHMASGCYAFLWPTVSSIATASQKGNGNTLLKGNSHVPPRGGSTAAQ